MFDSLCARLKRIWQLAIPFGLFRSAHRGGERERKAAYRFNRSQRDVLLLYVIKWFAISFCLLQALHPLTYLLTESSQQGVGHVVVVTLCVMSGIGFAFACAVIAILLTSYFYLCLVEE